MAKKPVKNAGAGSSKEQQDPHALEKAAVGRWMKRVKTAVDDNDKQYKKFTKMRRYASGQALDGYAVKANLIKSTIATLVPHIYARDPEVNVRPSEAVAPDRYEVFKKLARTCEIVIGREFLDGHLKRQAKRCVRSGITCGLGWLKVGVQTVTGPDPIIQQKIEDTRQTLQHLEALIEAATDDTNLTQQEADQAQLADTLMALEKKLQVTVATGLSYDFAKAEDMVVLGDINELIDYRQAPAIAHRIWYTPEQAQEEFKLDKATIGKAETFNERFVEDQESAETTRTDGGDESKPKTFVCAWEIWSKEDQTIYTILQGLDQYVRPPYTPDPVGRRFYSMFLLAFHYLDGEFWPGIDVEDWIDLQEEFCDTRSGFRKHRKRAVPARIFDKGAVSEADAKKMTDPEQNEMIGVENPNPQQPIENVVGLLKYPPIDEALYDTAPIRSDMMLVSGIQDADRGAVFTAKTATEANIQESGNINRLSDRTDSIEDWLQEIAKYSLEIALQVFTPEQVQRIAGPEAVWPKMSRDEIYGLLDVDIKAGSTGKPNRLAEQQAWGVLLPQTQQMVLQIASYRGKAVQAQVTGNAIAYQMLVAIADALEALLRETYRRADERLDPDEFIPQMPKMGEPAPVTAAPIQPNPQPGADNGQAQADLDQLIGGNGVTVVPAGPQRGVQPGDQNTGNVGAP